MAHKLENRNALLYKIEATYNTDPVPTGALDAMYVYDFAITPMELESKPRMPVRPFFGADLPAVGGTPVKFSFSVPIAGSGAAGTDIPAAFSAAIRSCGHGRVNNVGVDTIYPLVSAAFDSGHAYINRDGVLHKTGGVRGSLSREFTHNEIPMYKFGMTGIYVAPADAALPALTFPATWQRPLLQDKVNTTFALHGFNAVLSKLSIDDGTTVPWKNYVNLAEEVRITGRAAPIKGSVSIEADTIAAKDWFTLSKAGTAGALALTHGPAGNRYKLDAANVVVKNPAEEHEDGVKFYKLDLEFYPSAAGNDELVERFL